MQYERDGWMLRSLGIRDVFRFWWIISGSFLRSLLGQAWDNLEASLGNLGAIFEPYWGLSGASVAHLRAYYGTFVDLRAILGLLGAMLWRLGGSWSDFEAWLGGLGRS